jgi:hypothetical protein
MLSRHEKWKLTLKGPKGWSQSFNLIPTSNPNQRYYIHFTLLTTSITTTTKMKGAANASSSKTGLTRKEKEKAKRQRPMQARDNDGDDDEIVNTTKREFGRSTRREPTSHHEVSRCRCQLRNTDNHRSPCQMDLLWSPCRRVYSTTPI